MEQKELALNEVSTWVETLTSQLSQKQVILLSGEMGAGKTHWVKKLLESLGCDKACSPTYGLIHEYPSNIKKNIYHVDLYRLNDEEDLESSGFWDLFDLSEGLLLIEWADRLDESVFPMHWDLWKLQISSVSQPDKRLYNLKKNS